MSSKTPIVKRPSSGRRPLVLAILAMTCSAMTVLAVAQESSHKTIREHIKEYWDKVLAKAEAKSRAAGEQYHKLKDEAARASGPAREKMAAEMEILSKKWVIARERLASGIELRMHALGEEVKDLEEKAGKASGPAREKMAAEIKTLHEEWHAARAKMEATLSSNLKSSREEVEHLKEHAAGATEDAKAKLRPHMERLKSEYHKNRDKLAAYLESDLEQTKEDMAKLRESTAAAAESAREKAAKKYHELKAKLDELAKEKSPE